MFKSKRMKELDLNFLNDSEENLIHWMRQFPNNNSFVNCISSRGNFMYVDLSLRVRLMHSSSPPRSSYETYQ